MASPVTRGHPRDWRVGAQAPDNGAQLRRRQTINEQKPCSCHGCDRKRAGVSRYCGTHRDTASSRGDPLARLPSRNELAIFRHAIAVYLQTDAKLAQRIAGDLRGLERRMAQPPAFCLSPSDIHKGLPQIAKAKGLLANWQHRDKRTYTEAVTNALALVGWVSVYYDTGHAEGLWENRKAFLATRAGALLGDFRKTIGRTKLIKEASGATHRLLGRDFVHHANAIYGKGFWSSPVSTNSGSQMTLLDYTRMALRAANLL
ncbi:hypothetical protein [Mesorhizobium sp. B2-8-3]|uniref:hypothetical protein n=1 Tax=Mesorhizobium sp. B2-8-3 TaxID=2589905 RepID=UPI001128AB7E|nr:hypothetical protein [Mesorhizobium sp. B2-8-3]TPJ34431.1 hypothetical protein FJ418_10335 [Mesorhizobium sp. B2-8-3]